MKVLGNRVAIKLDEGDDVSKGGIFIPQSAKDMPNTGKVFVVGEGVKTVKIDDRVIFSKYHGVAIEFDDISLLLVTENDILAVIEE